MHILINNAFIRNKIDEKFTLRETMKKLHLDNLHEDNFDINI